MDKPTFTVRLEPAGHSFAVEPGETILAAALRAGHPLPYSCRNGSCGACKGRVLQGEIDYGVYEATALSAAERAAGKALFCQAVPKSDVVIEAREVAAAKDIVIKTLPCRVVALQKLAPDVMRLALKLPQQEPFKFLAGQYIDILLRDGSRRSFSLANPPPYGDALELHVRHVPGGSFSTHVFTTLKEKDLLRLRGPLGMFFLRESTLPIIFVAGGTGFAPIKSIIEDAIARGITRPMHLYWGARARGDLYLHELAQSWAQSQPHIRYTPVLSEPRAEDQWQGRTGWVHQAVLADHADLAGIEVYAGGPPPMIQAIRSAFFARGLAEDRLYYDSFEYAHAT